MLRNRSARSPAEPTSPDAPAQSPRRKPNRPRRQTTPTNAPAHDPDRRLRGPAAISASPRRRPPSRPRHRYAQQSRCDSDLDAAQHRQHLRSSVSTTEGRRSCLWLRRAVMGRANQRTDGRRAADTNPATGPQVGIEPVHVASCVAHSASPGYRLTGVRVSLPASNRSVSLITHDCTSSPSTSASARRGRTARHSGLVALAKHDGRPAFACAPGRTFRSRGGTANMKSRITFRRLAT